MAATGTTFPMFSQSLGQKLVDIDSDTLKVALMASYTYSAAHQYWADVKGAGTESTDADYTAGGVALTSVTWTRSGAVYTLDAADVSWASTVDAAFAVIYDSTPASDATRPVIGLINLDGAGGTVAVPGIAWHSSGILTATAA
jgi:hypothetical protein